MSNEQYHTENLHLVVGRTITAEDYERARAHMKQYMLYSTGPYRITVNMGEDCLETDMLDSLAARRLAAWLNQAANWIDYENLEYGDVTHNDVLKARSAGGLPSSKPHYAVEAPTPLGQHPVKTGGAPRSFLVFNFLALLVVSLVAVVVGVWSLLVQLT